MGAIVTNVITEKEIKERRLLLCDWRRFERTKLVLCKNDELVTAAVNVTEFFI